MKFKKFTIFAILLLSVLVSIPSILADELKVFDISNPADPKSVGFSVVVDQDSEALVVSEGNAYIVGGRLIGNLGSLEIFDISTPEKPDRISGISIDDRAYDIALSENYAYVVSNKKGDDLEVFDISNLENPKKVGGVNLPDTALGVDISGELAYIVGLNLVIYNISNPANPKKEGEINIPGTNNNEIIVSGDYAYVASSIIDVSTSSKHLEIFDISDPTNPAKVGGAEASGPAWDIALSGSHVYLLTNPLDGGMLEIFDISDPGDPIKVGSTNLESTVGHEVAVSDGYAYVTGGSFEKGVYNGFFEVYDISSEPTNPMLKGKVPFFGRGLDISGNYAYLVGKSAGLQNICKLFNLTEEEKEKIIQNLEDKQEKIEEKHNEIKAKIQASLEEAIKNGVQSEVEWRAKFKVKIEMLKSIAQTDEQKQAVQTFESDVLTARDTFREANNNSRNEFHDGLKDLVDQKQGNIQAAIDTFQTGVENAFNKANSSCEANEEASAILSTFKEDMNAAKEKVKSDMDEVRNNMQPQVDALIQTRQSQVETAKNDFVNAITSAAQELKNSFM